MFFRNAPGLHRGLQRFERRVRHRRHQQTIRSCHHGAHRRFPWRVPHGNSAHVHRVGNYESFESKLLAQHAGKNIVRKRCGRVRIGLESGNIQMPVMMLSTCMAIAARKGNKFQIIQARAIRVNHRQINVRVRGRIAVARKMFGGCEAAIFLHARTNSVTNFATRCGSSPKERVLIIGFPGLLLHPRPARRSSGLRRRVLRAP